MYGHPRFLLRLLVVGLLAWGSGLLSAQERGTSVAEVTAAYSGSSHVLVEWITLGETNSDYYAVERSEDGVEFAEIGRLTGQGRTNLRHEYNFFDYRADAGQTVYYRVREVNFGGTNDCTRVYVVSALRVDTLPVVAIHEPVRQ